MWTARSKLAVSPRLSGLLIGLCACSGTIADPGSATATQQADKPVGASARATPGAAAAPGPSTAGAAAPGQPAAVSCDPSAPDPGPSPLQRLTPSQYANSVRDLFGDVPGLAAMLGDASAASEFGLVQPDVAPVELETYQSAAELIAANAVSSPDKLQAIAPCASGADKRGCAQKFIQSFGAHAYRAPLADAADGMRHLALYDLGAKTSHEHGIELVLRAILQAPRFLYRVELGSGQRVGAKALALSGREIAARLSYALWDTLPDAALSAAADSGELDSPDGVSQALAAALADPKGSHALRRFLLSWLHLPALNASVKDDALFPAWNASLRSSMQTQAERFLDDVLARQGGGFRALLSSSTVFVNQDLGPYYGISAGAAWKSLERSDGHTAGVLTLPGFLALMAKPQESSPIYRGKFVREALLCQTLPAPPANIPKPPEVTPGVSTRARLAQHESDAACSGCHKLMDPIGFGFENFDAVGRFRSDDAGDPVDARGELFGTRALDGPFVGVPALASALASSDEVKECMARQWFRFVLGRFERAVDACSLAQLVGAFEGSGANLNSLPQALVATDAFVYRHPLDFEETP
jgi:hypothetical protein